MIFASLREMKFPVVPVSAFAKVGVESLLAATVFMLCLETLTTGCALSLATPTPQAGVPLIWLANVAATWCPGS